MNPSRRWRLAEFHHVVSSLAERSNPNTKANQTQSTEVFIKKKKKSPIHNPKPNPVTHGRSRCRHRRSIIVIARSIAPHRRSEIGERKSLCLCFGARCSPLSAPSGPPSRYFALFLSTLSQSLTLYLTEIKTEMNRRSTS